MKKWDIQKVRVFVREKTSCLILSEEYINTTTLMSFECKCGKEFKTTWKQFSSEKIKKRQCNDCGNKRSNQNRIFDLEFVRKYCSKYNLVLLSVEYKNCKTPLNFKCSCGNHFSAPFDYLKNASRHYCYVCQPKEGNIFKKGLDAHNKTTKKDFLEKLKSKHGNEYELVSNYSDVKEKIKLRHKCGKIWTTNYDKVINGNNECPECFDNKNSKLSRRIQKWLDDNGYEYLKEYSFLDCVYKRPLKFDFAIIEGEKVMALVEADGQQHFKPFNFIKDKVKREKKFEETIIRDTIKNKYAISRNIQLIRIPYFEYDNVETILNKNMLIPSQADESK